MDGFFTSKNGSLSDFVHEKEKPLLLYDGVDRGERRFIHPILTSGTKDFSGKWTSVGWSKLLHVCAGANSCQEWTRPAQLVASWQQPGILGISRGKPCWRFNSYNAAPRLTRTFGKTTIVCLGKFYNNGGFPIIHHDSTFIFGEGSLCYAMVQNIETHGVEHRFTGQI